MLNKWDEKKIQMAIISLENSPCEKTELAKWIYTVAFSASIGIEGTPSEVLDLIFDPKTETVTNETDSSHTEEVVAISVNAIDMLVPCLYKSEEISDKAKALIKGSPRELKVNDFAVGDLLYTDEKVYIFDGEALVELCCDGIVKKGVEDCLRETNECVRWALLRPAQVIKMCPSTEFSKEGFTEKQLAVVTTAESFMLRGMRMQYDDTRFLDGGEFRWKIHGKTPEDYTLQEWGYSNCAAFAIDVYKNALGFETTAISGSGLMKEEDICVYRYKPTMKETDDEKEKIKEEFLALLEPGDIIAFLRFTAPGKPLSGHVMLYIGCGDIIHSSGASYKYADAYETFEPTVRYQRAEALFDAQVYPTSHFFDKLSEIAVIRPILNDSLAISDSAAFRMGNMENILAEKLCSHNKGMSVTQGESITYTVSIYNTGDISKTLEIKCDIPENTTLLTDDISGEVTVGAGEKKELSYTLKVESGKSVSGKGTFVGGLEVSCPDIAIRNTLTVENSKLVFDAVENCKFDGNAIENANSIYRASLDKTIFEEKDFVEIRRGLLKVDGEGRYIPRKAGGISKMSVPNMWGGRKLYTDTFATGRVSLMKSEYLLVGDLLLVNNAENVNLYIWSGSTLINLDDGEKINDIKVFLEGLLGVSEYFIQLRPSMMWE